MAEIKLHALPREEMTWDEFMKNTPEYSIALDGIVTGGPRFDYQTKRINFDHHDNVVRDATKSTSEQVFYKIKQGLFELFKQDGKAFANVYVNDPDQDVALAVWQLRNHKIQEGIKGNPLINRLRVLTDQLDCSGGTFPQDLEDRLVRQHEWVFEPYQKLRKSGALSTANSSIIEDNIDATCSRITDYMLGRAKEIDLDTRHEIYYESPHGYKITNEIGGNSARYHLISKGMNAFIAEVSKKPNGNRVMSIGRRGECIPFPVPELLQAFSKEDVAPWGGSDIIGGSNRELGTALSNEDLARIADPIVKKYRGN